jgi:hypothetical protein
MHAVPQFSVSEHQPVRVPIAFPKARPSEYPRAELVLAPPPSEAVFGPLSQRGPPA